MGGSGSPALQDAVVVVTGACGGIGLSIAHELAAGGADVWAVDLDPVKLNELVAVLPGERHRAFPMDLASATQRDALVDELSAHDGSVLGLAHAAAVLRRKHDVRDITEDDWDFQIDVNLKATFFLNRSIGNLLVERGNGGSIVNLVSQSWWTGGFGGSVVYAASKGGIVSMSRGLARAWASENVRVNTVAPGFVDTAMMRSGMSEQQLTDAVSAVPMGRLADPVEVAQAVTFLLAPSSSYMTGTTMNVSGGQLMY